MSDYQTVVSGLREWTATHDDNVRAAVELLIDHGHWLHDTNFIVLCVSTCDGMSWIRWSLVAELLEKCVVIGSRSELAILKTAVMIARDTHGLSSLDRINRALVVRAIADALGVA